MLNDWSDREPPKRRPFIWSWPFWLGVGSAFGLIAFVVNVVELVRG